MSYEQYKLFVWIWIAIAVIIFFVLQFIRAPYGRYTSPSWGPLFSNKIGWFIQEFFVVVVLFFFLLTGNNPISLASGIIIGLFTAHYLNRGIIYPIRIRTKGKKIPVAIMAMAMSFNLVNGFLFGYYVGHLRIYTNDWLYKPQFIIGLMIFISGVLINNHSDNILISLRKPNETDYKIPVGGLFKYTSAPNMFGEIIEWLGFAILTLSLPGLAFLVWTCANLIPRAVSHHKWYLEKFADYPKDRKAIIPFIW